MDNESNNNNTNIESAHIEQSHQSLTEELSLKNIAQILVQNWALFAVIFAILSIVLIALYNFKIPYQSMGSVIINDNKNSSLQSFTTQFVSNVNATKVNEAKKANSSVQKSIEYLKTTDFYLKMIRSVSENKKITEMTISEKAGYDQFKSTMLNNKMLDDLSMDDQLMAVKKIDGMIKLNLQSDFEIEMVVSSLDKDLAYFVSKNALPVIANELKRVEEIDLNKVKSFLTTQKSTLDQSIQTLNKELSDFQSKPENLISLGSNKVGDYLSELMVRKNEIKMKISENNQIITSLGQGITRRDSALYGNSGKIQNLKIENEMLQSRLSDLQKTMDRVLGQAKSIPSASITYDELKKKSDLEFQSYKQVTESLAKIDAYELSLNNKFEILESPRYDKVKPFIGIATLLLLSILLTQVFGSIIIYIRTIWDTKYVTAQQTRNIVLIDGHSLDPRVIIENSKIKFSLRSNSFDGEQDRESRKRLGFDFNSAKNMTNTKTVNGNETSED
ncbi:MAG: hypothetical protein H7235_11620 [Bdellovibrionaceae bacterium]|nr:hypothetical protein [Pseudobdellovibrionaceae bacterium]